MAKKWSMSKWSKYRIMKKSAQLAPHLPETLWMRERALSRLLSKYGEVIVKPCGSYGGKGVIRITKISDGRYQMHDGSKISTVDSKSELLARLKKRATRNYIVQQYIPLARAGSRPFDLRVMVQRGSRRKWLVTGKLAKVAGKGFIVTNIRRSNGVILPVEKAVKRSVLKGQSMNKLLSDIDQVALQTAKKLEGYYPFIRTMGIDMGLDEKGHVWIIEANFAPMVGLFRGLKDKSMYRKIVSLK
ncbi:MAG: yheD 8 [Paenibacillus sp.]|jgi:hypothetical protein|nr:yheD 8 [Paenibacillus sp.]